MARLFVRIYLAVLGSLALFAVLVGLSGWLFHELREPDDAAAEPPFIAEVAEHLLPAGAAPEALAKELAFWSNRTKFDLALLGPGGQTIAEAGAIPAERIAAMERRAEAKGVHWRGPGALAIRLDDGRKLIAVRAPQTLGILFPLRWLGLVFAIGVAVAAASYPLVRRLTKNLERLQQGVTAFGRGNLKMRVPVRGRDEVANLAKTFNAAAEQIEALVATQKRLLANASHELRSPLARLRMAAEGLGGPAEGERRDEIARNIAELDGLVDEILLASRLDAGTGEDSARERIDLAGLLAEECAGFDANLTVGAGGSIFVEGEGRLLHRLFRNLLENARRHGGDGLTDVGAGTQAGWAVVTVCDRGPGIPEGERDRIFDPFYRLAGYGERAGGVGLGLALVRQIAQKHSGAVRHVPREGGGACFEVRLPILAGDGAS
jgi:signal transduction histidine kinase